MKKLVYLLTFLFIQTFSLSQIINIPDDYPTIQQGIDAAGNGDTILVDTGIYEGNINFNGKNITVASHYLITSDTSYLSQTIISGGSRVVNFENGEDTTAILCGSISVGLKEPTIQGSELKVEIYPNPMECKQEKL